VGERAIAVVKHAEATLRAEHNAEVMTCLKVTAENVRMPS
jgi:hypothetical protein